MNFVLIITARIQRMGEGTVLSLFVSSHLDWGGVPHPRPRWGGEVPHPKSGQGRYPIPGLGGGTPGYPPWPGLDAGGVPRVPPSQVWMVGGTQGTPWPGLDGGGVPRVPLWPGLDGGGYSLARSGWWGVPEVPPLPGLDGVLSTPIRQSSIASTCYLAGGMPLAFTQEDFLVLHKMWSTYIHNALLLVN